MNKHVVIIGAGQAGGTAAALLRQHGYQGPVTLVGEEAEPPYQRPPLSKAWLKGQVEASDLYMKPATFYADKNIEMKLGVCAEQVDIDSKQVVLNDGSTLGFDHLILACGARARELPSVDTSVNGVHYLRSMEHATGLKEALANSKHIVIIGGGFIGLEVAASARILGVEVTVIEREPKLLSRLASDTIAEYILDLHHKEGVNVLQGTELQSVEQHNGAVQSVTLSDGTILDCDMLLVGIGSIPNTELAEQAGLHCDNGVVVDNTALTNNPNVSAIGDMTRRPVLGIHQNLVRLESVPSSLEQAKQAALRLSGKAPAALETPWFWSDQYSTKLQMVGLINGANRVIKRGSEQEGQFSVFHFLDDVLIAAECINSPRDFMIARKVFMKPATLDITALADTEQELSAAFA